MSASRLPGQVRGPELPPRLCPGGQSRGPTFPVRWGAYYLWGLRDWSRRMPLGGRKVQVPRGLLRRVQHDTAHRQMSHQDMASQHKRRYELDSLYKIQGFFVSFEGNSILPKKTQNFSLRNSIFSPMKLDFPAIFAQVLIYEIYFEGKICMG